MRKVSSKSPRRMPSNVAIIAIRRSQSDFERASLVNGALLRSRSQPPTICRAERIHQIPVVDEPGVRQVEAVDLLRGSLRRRARTHRPAGAAPALRSSCTGERSKLHDFVEPSSTARAAHRAKGRNLDADEAVALAVLAGRRLEEALQDRDARRVRVRSQLAPDRGRRHARRRLAHRSYDSRRADGDCRIMYFCGSAQNIDRSSARLEAPP